MSTSSSYQGSKDTRENSDTHSWFQTPYGVRYLSFTEAEAMLKSFGGKGIEQIDGPQEALAGGDNA
jgi:hypothetical protein